MHMKVLEGSEGPAEASMGVWRKREGIPCRGSRAQPPNPAEPSLPARPRPSSPVDTVLLLRLHQESPLLWAKDKEECGLVSRIIKLHTADSSPARPVLAGFRAAFGPAGLWLPLMRIMIRRLNDNSSLILSCLQNLCWPTRSPGSAQGAPHQPRHCRLLTLLCWGPRPPSRPT